MHKNENKYNRVNILHQIFQRGICSSQEKRKINFSDTPLRFLYPLNQVISQEEMIFSRSVLLGFSSDGNYLMFYKREETGEYTLYWKEFKHKKIKSLGTPLSTSLCYKLGVLRSKSDDLEFDELTENMDISFWQSRDDKVVITIGRPILSSTRNDNLNEDSSRYVTVSVSPSEFRRNQRNVSVSLHFRYSTSIGDTEPLSSHFNEVRSNRGMIYAMILNTGDTIRRIEYIIKTKDSIDYLSTTIKEEVLDSSWWKSSEIPIQMDKIADHQFNTDNLNVIEIECISQCTFDVEDFLGWFLQSSKGLHGFKLRNYDIQIIQVSPNSNSLGAVLCAIMEISSKERTCSPKSMKRGKSIALVFEISPDGQAKILQVLQLSNPVKTGSNSIEKLGISLTRNIQQHLSKHRPTKPGCMQWSNRSVLEEESLHKIKNPVYPYTIINTSMGNQN